MKIKKIKKERNNEIFVINNILSGVIRCLSPPPPPHPPPPDFPCVNIYLKVKFITKGLSDHFL